MRLEPKSPLSSKPLRQVAKPKPAKKVELRVPRVSWWTPWAQPEQREQFIAAAAQRNREGRSDPLWQRPDKLGQIGQL